MDPNALILEYDFHLMLCELWLLIFLKIFMSASRVVIHSTLPRIVQIYAFCHSIIINSMTTLKEKKCSVLDQKTYDHPTYKKAQRNSNLGCMQSLTLC